METLEAERKRVREEIRKVQERFSGIYNSSKDAIGYASLEGVLLDGNDSFCQLTGYSKGELVTRSYQDITPKEYDEYEAKIIERIIRTGKPAEYEKEYIRKDGSRIPVLLTTFVVKGGDGKPIGLAAIIKDITERKQAEQRLKESESFLNSVIEQSPFSTWISDDKGTNIKQNQACRELFGIERDEEVIGKFNVFKDEEVRRQGLIPLFEKVFTKGETVNFVIDYDFRKVKHVKVSGATHKILDATIFPIKDGNGKVTNAVVQHKDITEHKRAEEALRESEDKYRSLVNNVRLGIFRSTIGPPGKYLEVNPALEEITGYSREELLHVRPSQLYVHPEERQAALEKVASAPGAVTNELKFRKKDGAEITVLSTMVAIKDSTGKLLYFDGITEDITERKQAEEELRESEEKLKRMFEFATDGIVVTDLNGNIMEMNEAAVRLRGLDSKEKLIGRSTFELIAEKDRVRIMEILKSALEDRQIRRNVELTFLTEDGRGYLAEVSSALLKDAAGNPAGFIAIFRDITERKQAEEREKELQQELSLSTRLASIGELAAGIAHEINNPLTGILGFSERLLRKSTDEEDSRELERIYNEAQRAAKVVQNLLTFARRRQPKKEYSDVNDILQKALELRAYELQTSNIEVVTDLAPGLPEVMADFHQIQEVFLNIILNAEQAMTEASGEGKLSIKTEERKDYIRISFTDDGPGIPTEQLDKVFNPFFTTRGGRGGTGLGLSACHGIMAEHGGKIYARSKPGKGATFFVELPLTTKKIEEAKPS